MTNKEPIIKVKSEIKKIRNDNPNIKDLVCLIGGFETTNKQNEVYFVDTLEAAQSIYGTDESIDANAALKQIFHEDISGAIIVNITTSTSGENPTYSRNVTKSKLETALTVLNDIEFDLLYVASELSDEFITIIDTFAKTRFESKKPFGYIAALTRTNVSLYTNTASKLGDHCYACLTQQLEVKNDNLSLIESGAFLTNLIAKYPVGNSLTAKTLKDVTGLVSSYTFGEDQLGSILNGLGYFVVRNVNPMDNTYECVNSAGVNGLDLYINRVRDYVVNDFALREFLGEKNNIITVDSVKMECNRIQSKFRNNLKVVENINYAVEKKDSETVDVVLNSIQFAGVITEIDVYLTIEVI